MWNGHTYNILRFSSLPYKIQGLPKQLCNTFNIYVKINCKCAIFVFIFNALLATASLQCALWFPRSLNSKQKCCVNKCFRMYCPVTKLILKVFVTDCDSGDETWSITLNRRQKDSRWIGIQLLPSRSGESNGYCFLGYRRDDFGRHAAWWNH